MLTPLEEYDLTKKSVEASIKAAFPIIGDKHTLKLTSITTNDNLPSDDYAKQKEVKTSNKTYAIPVNARLSLIDNATGETIDQTVIKVADLPKITDRQSFIIGGTEYSVPYQLRVRPGIYTRKKSNDEITSVFNLSKGRRSNMEVNLNPRTSVFTFKVRSQNPKLYPILKVLGVGDDQLEKAWGKEVLDLNIKASKGKEDEALNKLHQGIMFYEEPDKDLAVNNLKEYLDTTGLDQETTKLTLGKSFNRITPETLVLTSQKNLAVNRGIEEPDERDSLHFKNVYGINDFLEETLRLSGKTIKNRIKNNLDRRVKINEIVNKDTFGGPIKRFFTSTSLAEVPEQTNPASMLSNANQISIMGEGGIEQENKLSLDMQAVHPSQYGFIDPIHTPESSKAGAVMHTTISASRDGNRLQTLVYDLKKRKVVPLTTAEYDDAIVGMPDEFDSAYNPKSPKVKAFIKGNKIEAVPSAKVTHVTVAPEAFFDITTNMIPFLNSAMGFRAQVGSKQHSQALPLVSREAPLVRAKFMDTTFENFLGDKSAVKASAGGTITTIRDGKIYIKGDDGQQHIVNFYDHFPLNSKSAFFHTELKVKQGDVVKKGQLLGDNNFTKDGELALGTNLNVAYMPYRGYNFEDGIVVTEAGSKKLTSEHLYEINIPKTKETILDPKRFKSYFPTAINSEISSKLDERGIIKKGVKLNPDDILVAAMQEAELTPEEMAIKRVARWFAPFRNKAEIWENDHQGEVIDVIESSKNIKVLVKTNEPARLGDKVAGRHGNKGVITKIVPDSEAPVMPSGEKVDLMFDPHAIITRLNPSQIFETGAAKVALKTGTPYVVDNFNLQNNAGQVKADLKKHGIPQQEAIFDPIDNKTKMVMAGKQYIFKLEHQASKKIDSRNRGRYDLNMRPPKGHGEGGKTVGGMEFYALLAHGAKENLREMATYKASKNDELWRMLESGQPLPPPKPTFATEKFFSMLQGAGINWEKKGNKIQIFPLIDKDIVKMSNGELKDFKILSAKNLQPMESGLFDPKITGGMTGTKWAHIKLNEPIPNPTMAKAISNVLDIKDKDYDAIINGVAFIDKGELNTEGKGITGGKAIEKMLTAVDVQKELTAATEKAKRSTGPELDRANKKIRVLQNLKDLGMHPKDYILHNVPIIPPVFRPTYPLPDGALATSDANYLYSDLMGVNKQLAIPGLPESRKVELRRDMNKAVTALFGLGDPISYRDQERQGFLQQVIGHRNKEGYFQSRLLAKTQDLSARAAIGVGPDLHPDEAGIPEDMAWTLYQPFVMRNLVSRGFMPLDARKHVADRTPAAKTALDYEMKGRPVFLNRAPSLHKFSFMAMKPKIVKGDTIFINPLVTTGFNADFDGDNMNVHVPLTEKAAEEAWEMLPSKHLFKPTNNTPIMKAGESALLGLYDMTRDGQKTSKSFMSEKEAIQDFHDNKIGLNDQIKVKSVSTTPGRLLVNSILPTGVKNHSMEITKNMFSTLITDIRDKSPKDFSETVNNLVRLGNEHATTKGMSVSIDDFDQSIPGVKSILNKTEIAIQGLSESDRVKVLGEVKKDLTRRAMTVKNNALVDMATSGSKGNANALNQMFNSPVFVTDEKGNPNSTLVMRSYGQGMSISDYLTVAPAIRKTIIEKVKEVRDPSYFGKLMVNATLDKLVTEEDCGTTEGIELPVDGIDILGRRLMKAVPGIGKKNDVIGLEMQNRLKKNKVKSIVVRSPLKCQARHGHCAMCYGDNENRNPVQIGDNVGVLTAQAISEPTTQLTLGAVHKGGGVQTNAFERAQQLMFMPETLPFKATLSENNGKVTNVRTAPAGGFFVDIDDNEHYVSQGRDVLVKKGFDVKKGDRLSSGNIKPQELLALKGMDAARNYLVDELKGVYQESGIPIHRKIFETAVKNVTNLTRVQDPGDTDFIPGDWAQLNIVDETNKGLGSINKALSQSMGRKLANPIEGFGKGLMIDADIAKDLKKMGISRVDVIPQMATHTPTLKSIRMIPQTTYDWMSRLNNERLRDTLTYGAQEGWTTDIHGNNPIPGYIWGAEFGKGTGY